MIIISFVLDNYADVVDNKRVDVIGIKKLGKTLENASPLEIMDRALEKYENDIDISIASDQKREGRIVPRRRLLDHCLKRLPPGASGVQLVVDAKNLCFQLKKHEDSSTFPEAFLQIAYAATHLKQLLEENKSTNTKDLHDSGMDTICITDSLQLDLDKGSSGAYLVKIGKCI
ncbi:hypothetical protein Tco_1257442 [Tanacetum coccineum]